jgi:O-antigen/teichoic acid export membrane protein
MITKLGLLHQDTKKMIFWGYFSNIVNLISGIVMLPLILTYFTVQDLATYYYIVSIVAFMSIIDVGYGPQLSKNITYIMSGAKKLHKKGLGVGGGGDVDINLLQVTINTSFLFYKTISVIAFIISLVIISNHFKNDLTNENILLVFFFSIAMFFSTLVAFLSPVFNGIGLVIEARKLNVINKLLSSFFFILFIVNGFGILAFVTSLLVSSLTICIVGGYIFYVNCYKKYNIRLNTKKYSYEIFKVIFDNAKNIGLYYISINVISRSPIIFGEGHLRDSIVAAYGFLLQIFSIINNFSTVVSSILQTKLTSAIVMENPQEILNNFGLGIFTFILLATLATIFGVFSLDFVLILFESKVELPSIYLTIIFSLLVIIDTHHQLFNSFLSSKNEFPFVKATLISAILTSILTIIIVRILELDSYNIIIIPFITQLTYNYWYWPKYVCVREKINYFTMLYSTMTRVLRKLC